MVRSNAEWLDHPHGQALAAKPVVEITKIGDSNPEPFEAAKDGDRPLSGLRVLDLTRILAGPVAARTLAEHGADVLMVAAENTPQIKTWSWIHATANVVVSSTSPRVTASKGCGPWCAARMCFPKATGPWHSPLLLSARLTLNQKLRTLCERFTILLFLNLTAVLAFL